MSNEASTIIQGYLKRMQDEYENFNTVYNDLLTKLNLAQTEYTKQDDQFKKLLTDETNLVTIYSSSTRQNFDTEFEKVQSAAQAKILNISQVPEELDEFIKLANLDLEGVRNQLNEISQNVSAIKDEANAQIDSINRELPKVTEAGQKAIEDMNKVVNQVTASGQTLQQQINELDLRLSGIVNNQSNISKDITAIQETNKAINASQEALQQLLESMKTAVNEQIEQVNDKITKVEQKVTEYDQYFASGKSDWKEFVDQNREVLESVDPGGLILSELIRSRKPDGAETPYIDLPTRLDEQIGKNSEFREFEAEKSFMARVFNESSERGVNIKWFGAVSDDFDISEADDEKITTSDNTSKIQAAINYANAKKLPVYFPDGTWNVSDRETEAVLTIPSGTHILMSEKALIRLLPSSRQGYQIFKIENVENVTIEGGAVKGDVEYHNGDTGEWGMGVSISNSKNVKISNLKVEKCFGDGFYVGGFGYGNQSENITINSCVAEENRRQGLSVINVDGLYIDRIIGKNTVGTSPQACIDFEPNSNGEMLKNIRINEVISESNAGPALLFAFGALVPDADLANIYQDDEHQIDIVINNLTSFDDFQGVSFQGKVNGAFKIKGSISLNNVDIKESLQNGIMSDQWDESVFPAVKMGSVNIFNPNSKNGYSGANGVGLRISRLKIDNSAENLPKFYGNLVIDSLEINATNGFMIRALHLQYSGGYSFLKATIKKFKSNQEISKRQFLSGFRGEIGYADDYIEITDKTANLPVSNFFSNQLIWNSDQPIRLNASTVDSVGSEFKVIRSPELDVSKPLIISTQSAFPDDYIYIASNTVVGNKSKSIVFDDLSSYFTIKCTGPGSWQVLNASNARSAGSGKQNPVIYAPNKPTSTNYPQGTTCINAMPREGTPYAWVLAMMANGLAWKDVGDTFL